MASRSLRLRLLWLSLMALAMPSYASDCQPAAMPVDALTAQVQAQLRQATEVDGLRLELQLIGDVPPLSAPVVTLLDKNVRSRLAVRISGDVCGRQQVVTAWFRLRAFKDVWVYGQAAKAGEPVTLAQPRREEVDLAGSQLRSADIAETLDGLWLAQDARKGMPVLTRQLQPEPLVKRDEMVRVVVHGPGLQISTQGKAMRQGMLGENVPVLLDQADSSLLAVVAGKGEVHVGPQ